MNKILNIVLIVFAAITLIILGLFIWGGDIPNAKDYTPVHTASLLNWAATLLFIAVIVAIIFPIIHLFTRPKQAAKSFIGLLGLGVIILIAYAMADGTPLNITGYNGPDNVPSRLILSDTLIYTMYIFCVGTVLTIFVTEILKKVR